MTEHWHATSALVGLPGMPGSRSIRLWGERKGWVRRREGRVSQWLESSLPAETQQALQDRRASAMNTSRDEAMRSYPATAGPAERSAGRGAFDTESSAHKPMTPRARATSPAPGGEAIADARLDILVALDRYLAAERPPRTDDAIIHFARAYNAGDTAVSARDAGDHRGISSGRRSSAGAVVDAAPSAGPASSPASAAPRPAAARSTRTGRSATTFWRCSRIARTRARSSSASSSPPASSPSPSASRASAPSSAG